MFRPDYPIRTPRLALRPCTLGDLDALHDIQSRPDVTRCLFFEARDRDEVRKSLRQEVAATSLDYEGANLTLAVVLPDTGTLIGDVMLLRRSQEHRQGEIGYIFHRDHGGQGYASLPGERNGQGRVDR
jgi:RimJ/RimL family protein N-acetyltransferase